MSGLCNDDLIESIILMWINQAEDFAHLVIEGVVVWLTEGFGNGWGLRCRDIMSVVGVKC